MFKYIGKLLLIAGMLLSGNAFAVLPNIFNTQPSGNVAASLLDTNFTFLESQGVQGLTTTGSSNAYVATPADAWVTGYSSYVGRALTVIPNFTNTAASTISVSGLGAASLYKNSGGVAAALASGDIVSGVPAILISDGTGFLLANPTTSTASGALVLLSTKTASASANIDFTTGIDGTYTSYIIEVTNFIPSAASALNVQFYQSSSLITSANYEYATNETNSAGTQVSTGAEGGPIMAMTGGNIDTTTPAAFTVHLSQPSLSIRPTIYWVGTYGNIGAGFKIRSTTGTGMLNLAAPTTGIRFIQAGGNTITTGTFKLYGVQ